MYTIFLKEVFLKLAALQNKCKCKECTEQYIGCHVECESYKAYRKELDEINELVRKHKMETAHFNIIKKEVKTRYLKKQLGK